MFVSFKNNIYCHLADRRLVLEILVPFSLVFDLNKMSVGYLIYLDEYSCFHLLVTREMQDFFCSFLQMCCLKFFFPFSLASGRTLFFWFWQGKKPSAPSQVWIQASKRESKSSHGGLSCCKVCSATRT